MDKEIKIINYTSEYKEDFYRLNHHWIKSLFVVEEIDLEVLQKPEEYIIHQGGEILFALYNNEVVGTVALQPMEPEIMELTKMAVIDPLQGQGIGRKLLLKSFERACELGAKKLILMTNSSLKKAVRLYHKVGFKIIHEGSHPKYDRCDMVMELKL